MDPYAVLDRAYQALGRAVVPVIGPAGATAAATRADARELDHAEALALAAEVQALASLIAEPRRQ